MIKKESRNINRKRRHRRSRFRLFGEKERPRLNVFRSSKHIYAQIIEDGEARTLVSASTLEPELKGEPGETGRLEAARRVGERIAQRAREQGIREVVFDRGGYLYHGRIKMLAEAARKEGLIF